MTCSPSLKKPAPTWNWPKRFSRFILRKEKPLFGAAFLLFNLPNVFEQHEKELLFWNSSLSSANVFNLQSEPFDLKVPLGYIPRICSNAAACNYLFGIKEEVAFHRIGINARNF